MLGLAEQARASIPALPGKSTSKTRKRRKRIAIGEGVEAGAEDDVLRDAGGDGVGETIFDIAAARGHESPEIARHGVHGPLEIAFEAGAEQWHGNGIVEDRRMVGQLMGGAADGDPKCCFAGAARSA